MKTVNELIKELCPNGVEYKTLSQIASVDIGEFVKKDKQGDDKPYPVYNGGISNTGRYDEFNREGDYILISARGANAGFVNCISGRYWAGNSCYSVNVNSDLIDYRFAYHFLKSSERLLLGIQQKGSIPAVSKKQVSELRVPIPPMEIQERIVNILDSFMSFTKELTEKLMEELSARKKQYTFYRNQLLSFDDKVDRVTMGELFEFRNGLSKGKEYFGKGTPFIRYTDVYNKRALRKTDITALVECTEKELESLGVSRGDVFFTRTSETAEDVGWSSVMLDEIGDCVFNGFTIKASPKTNRLLPEYCAYCFCTDDFRRYVTSHCAFTTRASLTGSTIAEYKLPVPSIEEQKKIADILDNFENICNDLNVGLPAEIEARKKQYEYYRDKLLTFDAKR